jgi:hypothetical protein
MSYRLLLLSIIILASPINGMKRRRSNKTHKTLTMRPPKKTRLNQSPYELPACHYKQPIQPPFNIPLPTEIQLIIFDFTARNTSAPCLATAAQGIRSLSLVTPALHQLTNQKTFKPDFLRWFADTFDCSDERVAQSIGTEGALLRLSLQRGLESLSYYHCKQLNQKQTLETLISNGVDLEFTYSQYRPKLRARYRSRRNALMIAVQNNQELVPLLLKNGADINSTNQNGATPVIVAVQSYIMRQSLKSLLQDPKVKINHQNKQGNSALMMCIINREHIWDDHFADTIKALLDAGADPELGNEAGTTPLDAAWNFPHRQIFRILWDAIDKKQTQHAIRD